ncbi:MAG: ATPase, T2SS/T4P/T4SS family [Gammaproteobacteria bacterium]
MFEVVVKTDKGKAIGHHEINSREVVLGKARGCEIQLKGWSVGGQHAKLLKQHDGIYIEDTGAGSGIQINGMTARRYGPLEPTDEVAIASYRLNILTEQAAKAQQAVAQPAAQPVASSSGESAPVAPAPAVPVIDSSFDEDEEMRTQIGVRKHNIPTDTTVFREERFRWRNEVHDELLNLMDLRRTDVGSMDEEELRESIRGLIAEIITLKENVLPGTVDRERLAKEVLDEAVGLGPLEDLLANDAVTEIMVNRYDDIYVEQGGKLTKSDVTFSSDDAVMSAIERIVSPLGRRIDESSPMVDARLKDGSRVNAIIPPLALKGPCITIRKFAKEKLTAQDLVNFGALDPRMLTFLETAVVRAKNVVISGGTGSGKTTLLNVLSNFIPPSERIVTVEDAAELKLVQPHLVSLEARPPNLEGKGGIPIRDLVKNCLRMRPDRIVVGECRGGEALDMLQAMNTGHDGSLTTAHANTPRDLLSRLEVMVMMSGMDLPVRAIRDQISSAVHLVVQQTRFSDGSRRVTAISELTGMEGDIIQMQEIFKYQQEGFDGDGKVQGRFVATGRVPEFYEDLRQRGINVDMSIFD